jgi:hypothetical protein
MSSFDFDYELTFNNTFDQSVIDNADIPNKSEEFIAVIIQEINKISTILSLYQGVNTMSTFATFDSLSYKVTVHRV